MKGRRLRGRAGRPEPVGTLGRTDDDDQQLDGGGFASWLAGTEAALRGEGTADVPCGSCTACCASSQFVHVEPDESDALAHIPSALLFPAPGLPAGHVLMGYDEHGRCPMLGEGGCSIYEHRPRTCRTYDCRVFAAAGVEPDDQPAVARQAARWRFSYPTEADRALHDAVRAAAARAADRTERRPPNRTPLAVVAIRTHREGLET